MFFDIEDNFKTHTYIIQNTKYGLIKPKLYIFWTQSVTDFR